MTKNMTVMRARQRGRYLDRWRLVTTIAIVAWLGVALPAREQQPELQESDPIEAALLRHGVGSGPLSASVVTAWNEVAHDIAFAEDQYLTFKGQRALAMMHLAMHDALNSIVPVYRRYAYAGKLTIGHPVAAVAQSAYDVLVSQYPDQQPRLAAQLAIWLDQVRSGPLRSRGIALGRATAAAILALRAGDGWDFPGAYEFRAGPGQYQTTPPWNGFVAQPGFRFAKPFVLPVREGSRDARVLAERSSTAPPSDHSAPTPPARAGFRPPPPPALTSEDYAKAFREVQDYGAANSTVRTADQTAYAVWWMEFAEGSVNRLARQLVAQHGVHMWNAARLFAHIGIALFDGYIAVWDSKYGFNHWRPYTAVRAADTDGNPDTTADPAWEPLRPTPPTPDYVSAHAAGCAASFGVLEGALGNGVPFTMETTTAPPGMPARTFANFQAAALECADSRVRLGFHFRYATDAGLVLGRDIARYTVRSSLRKLGHRD